MNITNEMIERAEAAFEAIDGAGHSLAIQAAITAALQSAADTPAHSLDERMKAAGMFTVAEMMGVTPLTKWKVQVGMTDLDVFSEWLDRKTAEYITMKAAYDLGDKDERDELYEWVLAHAGAYSAIRENFRAAWAATSPTSAEEIKRKHEETILKLRKEGIAL